MGVAAHLGISLSEYDTRIRTFIPDYDTMLDAAASLVPQSARTIVDLGVGTGALAARCLATARGARVIGIDVDGDILELARRRLRDRATLVCNSFLRAPIHSADAVVAAFALHHVRTRPAKARLYRRIGNALRPRGVFVSVDCQPAARRAIAREQRTMWKTHLLSHYSPREADALLTAWSREDVYVPLATEIDLIRDSGFDVDVIWRRGAFAVLLAIPHRV